MFLSEKILSFFTSLKFPQILPAGIEVMSPYQDADTLHACEQFYRKYYSDDQPRNMIIGINPGRFGGGVTGIPFTDPIRLKNVCGIDNPWAAKQELSSVFIYQMIEAFGGAESFYKKFFVSAVSPLGFTKDNKNLNYYDDKLLEKDIRPFVVDCFKKEIAFGMKQDVAFCLGDGKNFKYLSKLNSEEKFFERIVPLAHPRFIMQYKLKKKEDYIKMYVERLSS